MIKLLPILIVALLAYLGYRYIRSLPPEKRKGTIVKYAVYLVIGLLALAVVTGRIHWLGAVVAGALGLLKVGASTALRFLPFLNVLRRNNLFGAPVFKTQFIELHINLNEGTVNGKVLQGSFSERELNSLSSDEFERLEKELEQLDKRSYLLLKVARQRLDPNYNANENPFNDTRGVNEPSLEEARLILGLDSKFEKKDVEHAYKRLMQKLHPDRGGNDYLASRVNLARDILIKHLTNSKH